MSSYHSSFTYLNKNSSGEGFVIASFEPDSGFVDTYLGMEQVVTNSYDGTKKYFYGNKYNTSAEILITLVKFDGTDFSMADNRRALRWLTGSRKASWLDFYVSDKLAYSFYGNVTACQQQKLDARVIGLQITFTSIHPWAWSAPQFFNCHIGEKIIEVSDDTVLYKTYDDEPYFGLTKSGVVYNSSDNENFSFDITSDGTVYNDSSVILMMDNQSDDLYTLTNIDIVYKNVNSTYLVIENTSIEDMSSVITGIKPNEVISLSAGQFIISDSPNRIFGDDFNFVWPKLRPGMNKIYIDGDGKGQVQFTYRYPIKIGDCAIDVENLGKNPICEGDISGAFGSSDGITTLPRNNIMLTDGSTDTPYTVIAKDGYLHFSESNENRNRSVTLVENGTNTLHEITIKNSYMYLSDSSSANQYIARDEILLVDENANGLYKLTVKDTTPDDITDNNYSLYLSEI